MILRETFPVIEFRHFVFSAQRVSLTTNPPLRASLEFSRRPSEKPRSLLNQGREFAIPPSEFRGSSFASVSPSYKLLSTMPLRVGRARSHGASSSSVGRRCTKRYLLEIPAIIARLTAINGRARREIPRATLSLDKSLVSRALHRREPSLDYYFLLLASAVTCLFATY